MKTLKTISVYLVIIGAGIMIGYVLPRLPNLLQKKYTEGEYSNFFPNQSKTVILYGTATCSFCRSTREFFKANKIDFFDVDVQTSELAAKKHAELGGGGVPVTIIGNRLIRGFQPDAFQDALKALNKSK
ncbi:glutaredoxin family protein [Undibacterium flavidum]|uniref:Glutaredoxin family protein n=1 Tax=Undibacterium flavidum TaxID=2762297 RepID=A0ABR6YA45_9BURK|nr:glutaredoxin family protein [Undibacterium flavidum]MBC3873470.1 glutaredoxin family protein [Undibacterium flavidum]